MNIVETINALENPPAITETPIEIKNDQDEMSETSENNQENVIEFSSVVENPPPITEASDEFNNNENEWGTALENNQLSIEEFNDALENLLVTETSKETNSYAIELDEALEILQTVHAKVQTSPLDNTIIESMDYLKITIYLRYNVP